MDHYSNNQEILNKILRFFILSLLIASLGLFIGQYVPVGLMLPLMIVELGMIIVAFFIRKKNIVGYPFVFIFVTLSGVTIYPAVSHYLSAIGADIVLMALIITLVIFICMGFFGWFIKKDLSFLGSILFIILIGVVLFGLLSIFVPQAEFFILIWSIISAGLFSVYIMYDFNQMKNRELEVKDVPLMVLNLYLDFVNLFLSLLRILGYFSSRD